MRRPRTTREAGLTLGRTAAHDYWRALHAMAAADADPPSRPLEVVCIPGMPLRYNRYLAWTQERAFRRAIGVAGGVAGRSVLEIGCGTGRWSRALRDLGASVTAIDLSEHVTSANRARIPGITFLSGDVLSMSEDRRFDVAVSVTVLQHLTARDQEGAVAKLARLVREGGMVVLLENTAERSALVHGRSIREWEVLFAGNGFELVGAAGYGFSPLLRGWEAAVAAVRGRVADPGIGDPAELARRHLFPMPTAGRAARNVARSGLAVLSYLVEPLCRPLPAKLATQAHMVFVRRGPCSEA